MQGESATQDCMEHTLRRRGFPVASPERVEHGYCIMDVSVYYKQVLARHRAQEEVFLLQVPREWHTGAARGTH